MKKLLLSFFLLTGCVSAQALPFIPTSDPNLSNNYWYFLKTEGLYCAANDRLEIVFKDSGDANNDMFLWCFVDVPNEGYRLYNKGTKCYLQQESLLYDDSYAYTYYQDINGTNFYLSFYISEWDIYQYLYMNMYQDQYGFMRYMDYDSNPIGIFSVEMAKEGAPIPGDPNWTHYDSDGVGYGFIDGGQGLKSNESSNNLIDNNAATKFFGKVQNCYVILKASTDVAVTKYSIITANDSRQYNNRSLRSWKLQGSYDCTNWIDLDERIDYPMPFENQKEISFYVDDNRKFRFFKFMATQGATENIQLSEVWINYRFHDFGEETVDIAPTCGEPGNSVKVCSDCGAMKWTIKQPEGNHSYSNGVCTVCHINENDTVLLHNGQRTPYFMWGSHGYNLGDKENPVWPDPPAGWPERFAFDLSKWQEVLMPTASLGHTNGAFSNLHYNSLWYGEYNCYYFIRSFNLKEYNPDAKFTFNCVHDDNMAVFVNGQEVINVEGWTEGPSDCNWENSKDSFDIPASAFKQGTNYVAVFIQQNWGGAYFDYDLIMSKKSTYPVGDVNCDGSVNAADVTALYSFILNHNTTYEATSDVNSDHSINAADVTAVYKIILGQQ